MRSSPATVRARHFAPADFRPQDGKRQKKRSDATSLSLTGGMPPVWAASGKNIRADNLATRRRYGHK
ncbi:hypothetical protein PagCFBP13516_18780 [Pantoea agglomerans]|nr:hypothetical protein PagCFBP13516_18780 [Pantoea agglomerans]